MMRTKTIVLEVGETMIKEAAQTQNMAKMAGTTYAPLQTAKQMIGNTGEYIAESTGAHSIKDMLRTTGFLYTMFAVVQPINIIIKLLDTTIGGSTQSLDTAANNMHMHQNYVEMLAKSIAEAEGLTAYTLLTSIGTCMGVLGCIVIVLTLAFYVLLFILSVICAVISTLLSIPSNEVGAIKYTVRKLIKEIKWHRGSDKVEEKIESRVVNRKILSFMRMSIWSILLHAVFSIVAGIGLGSMVIAYLYFFNSLFCILSTSSNKIVENVRSNILLLYEYLFISTTSSGVYAVLYQFFTDFAVSVLYILKFLVVDLEVALWLASSTIMYTVAFVATLYVLKMIKDITDKKTIKHKIVAYINKVTEQGIKTIQSIACVILFSVLSIILLRYAIIWSPQIKEAAKHIMNYIQKLLEDIKIENTNNSIQQVVLEYWQ